jgi:hypothetical protein
MMRRLGTIQRGRFWKKRDILKHSFGKEWEEL